MSNDELENLPVRAGQPGELVISLTQEGLLVDGDPESVKGYIDRIKSAAGNLVDVAGVTKGAAGNLAGLAAGAVSAFAQSGQFVQLSAKSMEAIRAGNLIPGDPGFFRMTTVDGSGKFLQQLQWRQVSLGPTQMLSVQMIAVQMALKMAIAEVNESIKRVEGKVESVLKLAEADRIGDVRGQYATVVRMTQNLDRTGVLPATDWQSVAALGPDLVIVVEKLRAHVERTLDDFDPSKPVQDRAEVLKRAVETKSIGETLNLLILAEESLNNWQRLRIARVQDVEPEHRQHVVDDAFDLLATQVAQDGALYRRAAEVLETYRHTTAIDGFRYWSVRDIAKHSKSLKGDLDAFARARRHQLEEWQEIAMPSVGDAASHVYEVASDHTDRALDAASDGLSSVYNYVTGKGTEKTREAIRRRIARERDGDGGEADDGDAPEKQISAVDAGDEELAKLSGGLSGTSTPQPEDVIESAAETKVTGEDIAKVAKASALKAGKLSWAAAKWGVAHLKEWNDARGSTSESPGASGMTGDDVQSDSPPPEARPSE